MFCCFVLFFAKQKSVARELRRCRLNFINLMTGSIWPDLLGLKKRDKAKICIMDHELGIKREMPAQNIT